MERKRKEQWDGTNSRKNYTVYETGYFHVCLRAVKPPTSQWSK